MRCDDLESELVELRKESAKREEDLRKLLRESKVDVKALSNKLKQREDAVEEAVGRKDEELAALRRDLDKANAKLLEREMGAEIHEENIKHLRSELSKAQESLRTEAAAAQDKLTAELAKAKAQGKSPSQHTPPLLALAPSSLSLSLSLSLCVCVVSFRWLT